jgi:hypothetical protein
MAIKYTPSNKMVNKEGYLSKGVHGTPERYPIQDTNKWAQEEFRLLGLTPCSSLIANRHLRGRRRLHLQGSSASEARNQHEEGSLKMEVTCSSETAADF